MSEIKTEHDELILIVIMAIIFGIVFVFVGIGMVMTKAQLCKDIGKVVYKRELNWFECFSL